MRESVSLLVLDWSKNDEQHGVGVNELLSSSIEPTVVSSTSRASETNSLSLDSESVFKVFGLKN